MISRFVNSLEWLYFICHQKRTLSRNNRGVPRILSTSHLDRYYVSTPLKCLHNVPQHTLSQWWFIAVPIQICVFLRYTFVSHLWYFCDLICDLIHWYNYMYLPMTLTSCLPVCLPDCLPDCLSVLRKSWKNPLNLGFIVEPVKVWRE